MRVVSVVQQKGGEGKSTVTINLAAALASATSRVLVVDVDPQQSSAWWHERGAGMNFDLADSTSADELAGLRAFDYDVIIVDTPGSLQDLDVLHTVLDVSDFAVLPAKASALSLAPLTRTLNEHVIPRGVPYRVIANRVDPRSVDAEGGFRGASDLYDLLDEAGYKHFKAFIREYKIYEDAAAQGISVLDFPASFSRSAVKAQFDMNALASELLTVWAHESSRKVEA